MKYDICCIGHITHDKVITPKTTRHMPGGTAFYFSNAISHMDCSFSLITSLGQQENHFVRTLAEQGIPIRVLPSENTVYFENIYSENQDHRTQRVIQTADPFTVTQVADLEADVFHLGPLLNDDIPLDVIRFLSEKGQISLDVQGYLRTVRNEKVYYTDWVEKQAALPFISILKANEFELEAITGTTNIREGVCILADMGVQEIVITLGSKGSIIYKGGVFHRVPAYHPRQTVDATGCGDTYMAGYLSQKASGADLYRAGCFAAAMSTLKIENHGPFSGSIPDVEEVLKNADTGTVDDLF